MSLKRKASWPQYNNNGYAYSCIQLHCMYCSCSLYGQIMWHWPLPAEMQIEANTGSAGVRPTHTHATTRIPSGPPYRPVPQTPTGPPQLHAQRAQQLPPAAAFSPLGARRDRAQVCGPNLGARETLGSADGSAAIAWRWRETSALSGQAGESARARGSGPGCAEGAGVNVGARLPWRTARSEPK